MAEKFLTPENTKKLLEWIESEIRTIQSIPNYWMHNNFRIEKIKELLHFKDKLTSLLTESTQGEDTPPPSEARSREEYALDNLLNDIEEFLCHIENFTHGRDGDTVTELRYRIRNYNKQKKK